MRRFLGSIRWTPLAIIVVIVACIHAIRVNCQQAERQALELIGSVVAYDQLVSLTNITSAPQSEVLLVAIARHIRGQEAGTYIKIVYTHWANEASLPQEMFDGKSQWRFILKRDERCDTSSAEMKATKLPINEGEVSLHRLKFTSAAHGLVDNTFLPCYSLKPGDYLAIPIGSVASRATSRQNSKLLTLRGRIASVQQKPQPDAVSLRGTVQSVTIIETSASSAFIDIKLKMDFVNTGMRPLIFLKREPLFGSAALAQDPTDFLVGNVLASDGLWPSNEDTPEWTSLRENLDKPAPPSSETRILLPNESWSLEASVGVSVPTDVKRYTSSRRKESLAAIQQLSPVWYALVVKSGRGMSSH